MKGDKVRADAIIHGRVQGVCFRLETKKAAERIGGLKGYVKNLPDGTVEAVFEGERERVLAALKWCESGPPLADVKRVAFRLSDYTGRFKSFDIAY